MTTIAWRDGTMAADSQMSSGGTKLMTVKLFRVPGRIVGFSGHIGFGHIFVDWLRRGGQKRGRPEWKDTIAEVQFSALVMDRRGACEFWDEYLQPYPVEEEFAAIGSGQDVAYGAFEMGASAVEAVEAACRRNSGTGLPVVSMTVRDARRRLRE